MTSPLMTEREASEYLGIAAGTLRNWRSQHPDRLPALRQGRIIRYQRERVEAFFSENKKPAGGAAGQNTSI